MGITPHAPQQTLARLAIKVSTAWIADLPIESPNEGAHRLRVSELTNPCPLSQQNCRGNWVAGARSCREYFHASFESFLPNRCNFHGAAERSSSGAAGADNVPLPYASRRSRVLDRFSSRGGSRRKNELVDDVSGRGAALVLA
jgi:hypothetical protein